MFLMAVSLFGSINYPVLEADEVIKKVDKRAEYYAALKDWSYYFIPTNEKGNDWCYLINGKKYLSIGTNKRKELEKFYENSKNRRLTPEEKKPAQMSLF